MFSGITKRIAEALREKSGGLFFFPLKTIPQSTEKLSEIKASWNLSRRRSVIMIGRISGQYSAEALQGKKSRRSVSYNSGSFTETDNANISSFGSLLAKVNAEIKNIPDVREDVVADFKSRIESGTYNPPLDKLANVLYMAGMLEAAEE
ncbi:MAG: flagellar biosynthesis anti-sigma factor FlgM [Synergistaceae bacterium]|nr:flagellar biosynthesis anti-sigma factor FlgM [Synergistaceae bacterium]